MAFNGLSVMEKSVFLSIRLPILVLLMSTVISGCVPHHKTSTMMPAPVIFDGAAIDPFAHLEETQKTTETSVFYATNRVPETKQNNRQKYNNLIDNNIHLGVATVQMGGQNTDWNELYQYSLADKTITSMPIQLGNVTEMASIPVVFKQNNDKLSPALQRFFDAINKQIAEAVDKEIMVYVHGTKVDFANSAILTAEIDHFAGRDFVGVAFAWPSHQNILAYLTGTDVQRALDSSAALQQLLVLLAEHTNAEHINILSYSAGGRVASKALHDLHQDFIGLSPQQLREKFRLGAVVFAAADVPVDVFLERITSASSLANQVVITVSDSDNALKAAKKYMGGEVRAGTQQAEAIEEEFIISKHLSNVEIIDVSLGQKVRGFDITGHHYWYRHPWMSSDIIFLMRTDLPAVARGLTASQLEGIWYLSADYPAQIRDAAESALKGQWD